MAQKNPKHHSRDPISGKEVPLGPSFEGRLSSKGCREFATWLDVEIRAPLWDLIAARCCHKFRL